MKNENGIDRPVKPGPKHPGPDRAQHEILIEAASKGTTNKDAAALAGIAESTFYRWISHPDFGAAYTHARAQGRSQLVGNILDASTEDWRAAAWLLERMDPTNWGRAEQDGSAVAAKVSAYLQGRKDTVNETSDVSND